MTFDAQRFNHLNYACDDPGNPKPFELVASARISQGMNVLEIGPGVGRFLKLALQRGAGIVHGIDPREDAFQTLLNSDRECKDAYRIGQLKHTAKEWPDAYDQSLEGTFDMVFSQSVLHFHSREERMRAFRAIQSSLRPGGMFALALKSVDTFWISRNRAKQIEPLSENRWECDDGFIRTFFHIDTLASELQESGFAVSHENCSARPMFGYGHKGEWSTWLELIVPTCCQNLTDDPRI